MNIKKTKLFMMMSVLFLVILSACTDGAVPVEVTITFDTNGGSSIENISYDGEQIINIPDNPTKEGYIFDGWYWDNDTFERPFTANSFFDEPIQSELTVYAKWIVNTYKVEYVDYDGTVLQTVDYDYGTDLSGVKAPADPEKVGHSFGGWYSDTEFTTAYTFNTMPAEDVTVYAKWTVNTYKVEYVDYDGPVLQTVDYDYGTDLSGVRAPADPERQGYTFSGWDITLPATMPAEYITITATYTINQYAVSFESDGGTEVDSIIQDYNSDVLAPADPEKVGHSFGGWYSDTEFTTAYTFNTMPAEDVTIYAKWTVNTYKVEYVDYDGTVLQTVDYDYGTDLSGVKAPADPERQGYTFSGWDITLPATMPAENIDIKPKFEVNRYLIIYLDSSGNIAGTFEKEYDSDLTTFTHPKLPPYSISDEYDNYYDIKWDKQIPSKMPPNDLIFTPVYMAYNTIQVGSDSFGVDQSEDYFNERFKIVKNSDYIVYHMVGILFIYKFAEPEYELIIQSRFKNINEVMFHGNMLVFSGKDETNTQMGTSVYDLESKTELRYDGDKSKVVNITPTGIVTLYHYNETMNKISSFDLDNNEYYFELNHKFPAYCYYCVNLFKDNYYFHIENGSIYLYDLVSSKLVKKIDIEISSMNSIKIDNDIFSVYDSGYNLGQGRVFVYNFNEIENYYILSESAVNPNDNYGKITYFTEDYICIQSGLNTENWHVFVYDKLSGSRIKDFSNNSNPSTKFRYKQILKDIYIKENKMFIVNSSNNSVEYTIHMIDLNNYESRQYSFDTDEKILDINYYDGNTIIKTLLKRKIDYRYLVSEIFYVITEDDKLEKIFENKQYATYNINYPDFEHNYLVSGSNIILYGIDQFYGGYNNIIYQFDLVDGNLKILKEFVSITGPKYNFHKGFLIVIYTKNYFSTIRGSMDIYDLNLSDRVASVSSYYLSEGKNSYEPFSGFQAESFGFMTINNTDDFYIIDTGLKVSDNGTKWYPGYLYSFKFK
jgi:uncharacterized repeat protein (TIGR02543 family)